MDEGERNVKWREYLVSVWFFFLFSVCSCCYLLIACYGIMPLTWYVPYCFYASATLEEELDE